MPATLTRVHPSVVLAKDSKDNAIATASVTAPINQNRVYVTGVDASYGDSSIVGLLQLKSGSTVIWEQYVNGTLNVSFPSPVMGDRNTAFSAVLAASGAGSSLGKVNLRGYVGY